MNTQKITDKDNSNQIKKWSTAFKKQLKYMYALTGRLSFEQFNFKSVPGRWSVGACIEHLNLSMNAYLNIIEPVIKKSSKKTKGKYAPGTIMGRLMLRALRKPGKTYPAPRSFMPRDNELDPDVVRETFENEITRLTQTLENCDGLALGKITMQWPVFRLIRISLAQAFELQILHNKRHFKQAERVIQHQDFPSRKG